VFSRVLIDDLKVPITLSATHAASAGIATSRSTEASNTWLLTQQEGDPKLISRVLSKNEVYFTSHGIAICWNSNTQSEENSHSTRDTQF
jgi:hypothetical protein